MAITNFANFAGALITPLPNLPINIVAANNTLNAAGESAFGVGHMLLSTGPGTSATISAAGGGAIYWRAGAVTFNNGGTTVDIGIQDVGATGLEDGSYDVKTTLTGGTDPITANVVNSADMTTGTKTITHGDLVAVGVEMTARGGADSVVVQSNGSTASMPHMSVDSGAGPALAAAQPIFTVIFDNGTVGWFHLNSFAYQEDNPAAFGTGSTPDEYALVFTAPAPMRVTGLFARLASMAAADDFELILYSDPLGVTPVAERTVSQDAALIALNTNFSAPIEAYDLVAGSTYAIALRPSTANTLTFDRVTFGSGNGALRAATPLGTNWSQYTRSDQSGAFGSQDLTLLPMFGFYLGGISDGAGGGGAGGYAAWWSR